MASLPYKNILQDAPTDGVVYWARLIFTGYPFLATWHASDQIWVSLDGFICPWWVSPLYRAQ